jgi:hypothetical protein
MNGSSSKLAGAAPPAIVAGPVAQVPAAATSPKTAASPVSQTLLTSAAPWQPRMGPAPYGHGIGWDIVPPTAIGWWNSFRVVG